MKIAKITTFILSIVLFLGSASALPAAALTYSEISGQGTVLGASVNVSYPYPSGSLVNDSGTIYFISGATKIPFTNWQAFVGLGYSPSNVVKGDVSDYTPAQSYTINTANAAHPWGQWLYRGTVYYSTQAGMIAVPSAAVFLNNGGQWNLLVKANKYDLTALAANPGLPLLASNDPRIIGLPDFGFGGTAGGPSVPAAPVSPGLPAESSSLSVPSASAASGIAGSLNTATLSVSSPAGQFVLSGAQSQTAAVFNFTASGSPVTIEELDFMVQNSGASGITPPVSWIYVDGNPAPVLTGATSSVSGLNIVVPNNAAGVNVPVTASYANINPPNSPSNQIFTINLVGVKYVTAGQTMTLAQSLVSNPMDLVSVIPSVTFSGPTGIITDGLVLLGQVTVSATGGGGMLLDQLPISVTSSGNAIASSVPNNLVVDDDGYAVNTSNSAVTFAPGGNSSADIVFSSDNTIEPGLYKTYSIYLPVEGAVGESAGSSTITTTLGSPAGFIFNDIDGNTSGLNISGSSNGVSIANYSANSVTAHN